MNRRSRCKWISFVVCLVFCATMLLSACGRDTRQEQYEVNKQQQKPLEVLPFEFYPVTAYYKDDPPSHGVLCDAETVIAYANLLWQSWRQQTLAEMNRLEESGVEITDGMRKEWAYSCEYTVQYIRFDEENGVWMVILGHNDYDGLGGAPTLFFSKDTGELLGREYGE